MRKKILFIGMGDYIGGIERFLLNVCQNIDYKKFDIYFLVIGNKKAYKQNDLEKLGCHFFTITSRKQNYFNYIKQLKKIYINNNFDIIHFNIMNNSGFERIILAKKYSKAKLIIHSHSSEPNNMSIKFRILNGIGTVLTRNIDCERIACGKKAGEWLFGKKDFFILNNGINVEKFIFSEENRIKIRKELKIDNSTKVIGHAGAFTPVKNHKFLIDVFYEYQKLEPNSVLILIGGGGDTTLFKNQIEKLGITNKVKFLGVRTDIDEIYSALDIFMLPSFYEGLSIAIVEAQVNGLKCYTSTNVSKESNITGNVDFLNLKDTPKNWAKTINNNDNIRDKNVYSKIPNEFKIEETINTLTRIYENI